jgi:PTS system mannose-specific IIB component/fructoselysine and glucoselysine-specific PTS system IIB component
VPVELFRVDDRLIHGQVVLGWGLPLNATFIVLVDDRVAASDWERELYRLGVPPDMQLFFETVDSAAQRLPEFQARADSGILLTGSVQVMERLTSLAPAIRAVNLGGLHHKAGCTACLPYVFLSAADQASIAAMVARGIAVTAQDLPATQPVPAADIVSTGET